MDIDFKKLAPWNWFKKEQEEQQSTASLPVQRNDLPVAGGPVSPILQLHREIDRLFDDAFRGFGFPTLAMPRWPSDWPGMLKPALDIQETDKQYKIALEVPGIEEKDIQITLDNDVLLVRGEKRQEQETKDGGFHLVERPCLGVLASRLSIVIVSTPFLKAALIVSWLASAGRFRAR